MALDSSVLLDQVENAISAILSGAQSYSIGSRSLTRADLRELRLWRKELLAEVDRDKNGGRIRVRRAVPLD